MSQPLIYVRLVFPQGSASVLTSDNSWLLAAVSTYKAFAVYAFLASDMKKDASLGRIFSHLEPPESKKFTLELGVRLPDLLPDINGQLEYWLDVPEDEETRRVFFSNQMAELRYRAADDELYAVAPRNQIEAIRAESELRIPSHAAFEPVTTMATTRFSIKGDTAEAALEEHLGDCADRFVSALNVVLSANQMFREDVLPPLTADYDRSTFASMYVIMQGADAHTFGHGRFAMNIFKVSLNPPNLAGEDAAKLVAHVNGTIPISDVQKALHSAKSSLEGGVLRQALLQIVIATEMATRRYVHEALLANGTSKNKLEDIEKDLTFNMMLNVLLPSLAPAEMKPDRDLLGTLNGARKQRNSLMHEGQFTVKRDELRALYNKAKEYLAYLQSVARRQGLPGVA